MTDDKLPAFVRGEDGILERNPAISPFDRRSYAAPDEALNVTRAGETRLGCAHRMFENYSCYPCGKKPKHDPDANGRPTRCGIHSTAAQTRRKDKADAKMQAWRDQCNRNDANRKLKLEMKTLIQSIADGHNDPRQACHDWLARYNDATKDKEPNP